MKKKSVFSGILLLIIISLICITATVSLALLAGSADTVLFNLENLNFSNMIPVLIVCGIISCFVIGIAMLFVGRTAFFKVRDCFFEDETKEKRRNEK